ncbi:MAG: hypothetical protein M3N54_05485, partial [Acidobacteriota bacterium]|nr:hypothetical protein [Acidobacteriota bacterium]
PLHVFKGGRLIPENLANRYRRLQQAAAPGASLQARLDYPFLLDFRRNQVLIVDSPGGAGADPGLPYFQGPDRLAGYLVSQNIRYIAYDYASACGAPKDARWLSLAANPAYPMAQSLVRHSFDLNDNYLALAKTRALVYDDGSAFLIDLLSPRQPGTPPLKTQVP